MQNEELAQPHPLLVQCVCVRMWIHIEFCICALSAQRGGGLSEPVAVL